MATHSYVDAVNPNLICCICRMPFVSPVVSRSCLHTFCRQCIFDSLASSPQCPVDRSPISFDSLAPADPIVRNLVDELRVTCPNVSHGCTVICERQLVASHLRSDCPLVAANCTTCQISVPRTEISHTTNIGPECRACAVNFESIQPSEQTLSPDESASPPASSVEAEQVSCDHSRAGCGWRGSSGNLSVHVENCPYESIKGFIQLCTANLFKLEAENRQLRHNLAYLQDIVGEVRQSADTSAALLDPWTQSTRQPLSVLPGTVGGTLHSSASTEPPSTAPTQHTSVSGIGSSSHEPADQPCDRLPRNTMVAPLDTHASLYHSIASLHSSLVSVAFSLDTAARRQDIALSTESLRTTEELCSLKLVIHGIRMQVHSIMIALNNLTNPPTRMEGHRSVNETLWSSSSGPKL